MTQATFKTYSRQQIPLLPATYEDKIAANHPVRVVDAVIEKIDLRKLYSTYKGGGTSSYNPKMLLKAVIYAYIINTYSSRKIEEAIKDKEVSKKVKQKLVYAKKNFPVKLDEYKVKEEILDGRNSYSKTDNDATFMRMKEDHMKNGQLKPGYNVQITTNNQIITNYDTFANPTDTLTLPSHIESFKQLYDEAPQTVTADSGYGSEQNYECLEANNCTAYVKYNYFHQEQQGKRLKKYPFAAEHLYYNKEQDYYVCPMGQHMNNIGTYTRRNDNGFEQTISRYQAKNCEGCSLRRVCHKARGSRIIEVNHNLNKHKQKAREKLISEEGIAHRKQRATDVEAVFGNIKQNKGFRRFMLRGKEKVTTEFGWIAIAHNLKKKA